MSLQPSVIFNCACGRPICKRMYTINLALGLDEDCFCLHCLATHFNQPAGELFATAYHYVQNRECFAKAWKELHSPEQCPLPQDCAFAACFASAQVPHDV